jgi:hypothetical protein
VRGYDVEHRIRGVAGVVNMFSLIKAHDRRNPCEESSLVIAQ